MAQELVFSRNEAAMPWLPDGFSDYEDWSKGKGEHGTFVATGERYAFLQIDLRDNYSQYLIGAFSKDDEPENLKPAPDVQKRLRTYLSTRNRYQVLVYENALQATFIYGTRYCKPCIVCSKHLETVDTTSDHIIDQPSGGTNFTASGHYGSGAFDPMSREHLSINICDECLVAKGIGGFVTHVKERQRVVDESVRTVWSGTH